ncbi:hypothetical protein D3C73_1453330 [compost metagenome]
MYIPISGTRVEVIVKLQIGRQQNAPLVCPHIQVQDILMDGLVFLQFILDCAAPGRNFLIYPRPRDSFAIIVEIHHLLTDLIRDNRVRRADALQRTHH